MQKLSIKLIMKLTGLFIVSAILFFTSTTSCLAEDEKSIIWYHANFPPVSMPSGPNAGEGFFDKITKVIIQELPHYSHSFKLGNYKRILQDIKDKQNVCCAALYKTEERASYTAFSVPAVVVLPNGITIKKEHKDLFSPYINSDNKFLLNKALQNPNLILGIAKGRKYSGGIDEILAMHETDKHIMRRSGNDVFQGLLQMLLTDRGVHYIIGYPVEAKYIAQKLNHKDDILHYALAETSVPYTLGQVGCPDTIWGRKVIQEVDKVLLQHRSSETFLNFYESWLDEETAKTYRKLAIDFFNEEKVNFSPN